MKKLIITTLILCFCNSKAQLVDPGTQTQLLKLNVSMGSLLTLIGQSIKASNLNKDINEESKLLSKENLNFVKDIEEKLYKVSSFLQKGKEIKDIIGINVDIVKEIQELHGKFNTPDSAKFKSEYMTRAYDILSESGKLVNTAFDFISDDKLRMTPEGRISYLKDTRIELNEYRLKISKMTSEINLINLYYKHDKEKAERMEAVMRKARGEKE